MKIYKYAINELKESIDRNDLNSLKDFFHETDFNDSKIPWDYVYQKVYLYSCLKKKKEIKEWLESLFIFFNPITQIAIRQTFSYGNFIFHKN